MTFQLEAKPLKIMPLDVERVGFMFNPESYGERRSYGPECRHRLEGGCYPTSAIARLPCHSVTFAGDAQQLRPAPPANRRRSIAAAAVCGSVRPTHWHMTAEAATAAPRLQGRNAN